MPKLYHKGEWYFEIAPTALLEAQFESLLVEHAALVRPGAKISKYKRTVYSEEGSAQADLAIVSDDYREWAVVEVEMIQHPLHGHVIPQIRTLRGATYGQADAEYLARQNKAWEAPKLAEMMLGNSPDVLVIVNKPNLEWERALGRYGVRMMVFEVFRSEMNRYIFSIDGELPQMASDVLTLLAVDRLLPRFAVVASPVSLTIKKGERITAFIDDQATEWERVDIQTNCYLTPVVGLMPLSAGTQYALVRTDAGQYLIRPVKFR